MQVQSYDLFFFLIMTQVRQEFGKTARNDFEKKIQKKQKNHDICDKSLSKNKIIRKI